VLILTFNIWTALALSLLASLIAFEEAKNDTLYSKATLKKISRCYNEYVEAKDVITNCMCNKVRRKIYHNIIFEWYEKNSN
jgi:hypothetical protein